jgi:hypothetical protein
MNLTNARENPRFTQIARLIREASGMRNIRSILGVAILTSCTAGTEPAGAVKDVVLIAASPTSLTVAAGSSVDRAPTVIAYDDTGKPLAGVAIVFDPSLGAGTLYGAVDTTNSEGVAQLHGWSPGTKAGEKAVVTARSPNGSAVPFVATIVAGAPLQIAKVAGDNQVAVVDERLPISPQARVTDGYGNVISGAQVKFEVTKGGGSVTPSASVTDANGMVTASTWTVGEAGEQILTLDAGTATQTFHATSVSTKGACSLRTELESTSSPAWELTPESCSVNGKFFIIFYFTVATTEALTFEMRSPAFDTHLEVRDANSTAIAHGYDYDRSNDSRIRAIVRPGTYQLVAATNRAGDTGPFSLSIARTTPVPSGCEPLYVNKGDSTASEVRPVTCDGMAPGNVDTYCMHLSAGETVQVHLRDLTYSGFDIDIETEDGARLAEEKPGLSYLDYDATYSTDRDIDLVIKVSSLDTYAGYWITFK